MCCVDSPPDVCAASDLLCLTGLQVRSHFRPEFINRIDEFTVFRSLQRSDIKRIVILQAKRVEERLHAKKMKMKLLEPAIEFLAVSGVSHLPPCHACAIDTFLLALLTATSHGQYSCCSDLPQPL